MVGHPQSICRALPLRATRLLWLAAGLLVIAGTCAASPGVTLSTCHYRIHTDLDRPLAMDLARRMDAMFDEYARRFAGAQSLHQQQPLEVYLFRSRADYLALVGSEFQNTGGLFIPSRHLLSAFLEGHGRDTLRRTLQHEAFHQFAEAAFARELPPWLNEGLAQIFEESLWTGDTFILYQIPPRRIRQLQADLEAIPHGVMDIRTLVSLKPEDWAQAFTGDPSRGQSRYNVAWALVYFLAHGRDNSDQPYLPRLLDLMHKLNRGVPSLAAFDAVFPDVGDLQMQFESFVRFLHPTPEALLIERQHILADFMVQLWSRGQNPQTIADARRLLQRGRYRLHYTVGNQHWESDADVGQYFANADGEMFKPDALHFDQPATPLPPDIICRAWTRLQLRTHFFRADGTIEHETMSEAVATK